MNHDLFSHFTKVDKLLRRQARYAVREYDFTENEVLVITVLTNQKHITTASAIARFRGISKGLVAKSVDSLTEKGYLIQNKDLKDKRIIHLSFTEEGKKISDILRNTTIQFINQMNIGINDEHRKVMDEIMQIMNQNIERMEEEHE